MNLVGRLLCAVGRHKVMWPLARHWSLARWCTRCERIVRH
jgi:hypothetical protein